MEFDLKTGPKMPLTSLADMTAQIQTTAIKLAPAEFAFSMDEASVPESPVPKANAELGEIEDAQLIQEMRQPISSIEIVLFSEQNVDYPEEISQPDIHIAKIESPKDESVKTPVNFSAAHAVNQLASLDSNSSSAANPKLKVDNQPQSFAPAPQLSSPLQGTTPKPESRQQDVALTRTSPTAITTVPPADVQLPAAPPVERSPSTNTTPSIAVNEPPTAPLAPSQNFEAKIAPTALAQPQQAHSNKLTSLSTFEHISNESSETQISFRVERHFAEATPAPLATNRPTAPIGTQISTQIPQMLTKLETQTLELRLDPPELGRVTIHLNTHEHQVTAHISAERSETVELMRRHAELLTATLAKAGFSQANLSFQQGGRQESGNEFGQIQSVVSLKDGEDLPPEPIKHVGLNGRLDIRL